MAPSDVDADRVWLAEVQRRSAEFEAGIVKPIPAEEVFERVRSRRLSWRTELSEARFDEG